MNKINYRDYEVPLYWKLLKISKRYIDTPTDDPEQDLYHLFNFSQIVNSMNEKLKISKYTKYVPRDERCKVFGDKELDVNTATSKIVSLSKYLRHYKESQSDSRHFNASAGATLNLTPAVYVNGILQSSDNTKKEKSTNPSSYEAIEAYIKILTNDSIKIPRETFDECFEEIKQFMKKHFELD